MFSRLAYPFLLLPVQDSRESLKLELFQETHLVTKRKERHREVKRKRRKIT